MADSRARGDLLVFVPDRAHRQQRSWLRAMSRATGTFALVFGISFAILYVVCDMAALPMFTYHPGTDRIDLGFTRPRRDEGPAMYWYGWVAHFALWPPIPFLLAAHLP